LRRERLLGKWREQKGARGCGNCGGGAVRRHGCVAELAASDAVRGLEEVVLGPCSVCAPRAAAQRTEEAAVAVGAVGRDVAHKAARHTHGRGLLGELRLRLWRAGAAALWLRRRHAQQRQRRREHAADRRRDAAQRAGKLRRQRVGQLCVPTHRLGGGGERDRLIAERLTPRRREPLRSFSHWGPSREKK